jgi:hypothetical protein
LFLEKAGIMKKDELVCYCFGYTVNDIESDALTNSRSLIIEKIAAEKKSTPAGEQPVKLI